jgi:hypothetical protein
MALIKCSNCGHEISDKASVCPKCGAKLSNGIVQNKGRRPNWIFPLLFAVIILFAVAFLVIKGDVLKDKEEKHQEGIENEKSQNNNSQNLIRFSDVFVKLSNSEVTHINENLINQLKERGYSVAKDETKSEYNDVYEDNIEIRYVCLTFNMDFTVNSAGGTSNEEKIEWKKKGSPCSGIYLTMCEDNNQSIIAFEKESDLNDFINDAKKAGFFKNDY